MQNLRIAARYPDGSLWILNKVGSFLSMRKYVAQLIAINQAKILRMTFDPDGAIDVLNDGLRPERPGYFRQADALVCSSPSSNQSPI